MVKLYEVESVIIAASALALHSTTYFTQDIDSCCCDAEEFTQSDPDFQGGSRGEI